MEVRETAWVFECVFVCVFLFSLLAVILKDKKNVLLFWLSENLRLKYYPHQLPCLSGDSLSLFNFTVSAAQWSSRLPRAIGRCCNQPWPNAWATQFPQGPAALSVLSVQRPQAAEMSPRGCGEPATVQKGFRQSSLCSSKARRKGTGRMHSQLPAHPVRLHRLPLNTSLLVLWATAFKSAFTRG